MKPILFNTDEVCATLDGRKTVKRMVVKPTPLWEKSPAPQDGYPGYWANWDDKKIYKAQYCPGDILYVRETWYKDAGRYMYKANYSDKEKFYRNGKEIYIKWHPSIHMPKEAARLFLRVTDVQVERLQDIDYEGCKAEGIWDDYKTYSEKYHENLAKMAYPYCFSKLWNSTIKKADLPIYGWAANPWVWVIEFERISKEVALLGGTKDV